MMSKRMPLPENERERLEALINFTILEKIPESEIEVLCRIAAEITQCQVAMISIVEGEKHLIKSSVGLSIYDIRNDFNFCFEVIKRNAFTEIQDALIDPELNKLPMVMGQPNFRYFAGLPIRTKEGFIIGCITLIDTKPRTLKSDQIKILEGLTDQIKFMLDLRVQNKQLQTELNQILNDRINQTEIDLAAYKFALDQSSGVAIADRNGYIKFVNDKFCKSSKYIKEEILGQPYNIFNSGTHDDLFFKSMWETISKGELWHGEIKNKDKQGNFFWVDCNIIPFLDQKGKPYQYMAIQQDITEKKDAEDRMTLETRLISILSDNESIQISIQHLLEQVCYKQEWDIGLFWSINNNEQVLFPEIYYQFTYPHNEILRSLFLNSKLKKSEGLAGKVWEWKKPQWYSNVHEEAPYVNQKIAIENNLHSSLLVPIIFDNEVKGVMQFFSSEIKKLDKNTLKLFESIGLQIGAFIERKMADEELLKAKKEAEESLKSKDQFLANMSHEIRTPMNAIVGFTDLLSQTHLNIKQKEYANSVKIAGENLLSIINDILDFSKIESGGINIQKIPSDIQQILKNVYDLLKIGADQKNLQFSYHFDEAIPETLMIDDLRLNQVLINLVGNAIKFTETGYVEFSATWLKSDEPMHAIKFSIKDTGIGIQQDKKDKIFERFSQVNNDINRKYEGTGLGLSISKNLIELMDGSLEMYSEEDIGSEFSFVLNLETGEKYIEDEEEYSELDNLVSEAKILIIEDNRLNQKLAKNVLNNLGFEVEMAVNGQIGLEMLKQNKFDLILMDLQMPELDGYQTTRILRNSLQINTPIIAMTAHSMKGEKEKCIAAGMNDFISKPFNTRELFNKISNLLSTKKIEAAAPANLENTSINETIEFSYLKELSEGNLEFENEMIEIFLRQVPEELIKLKSAANNVNEANNKLILKEITHKLKSSFDIFGRADLTELLNSIATLSIESNDSHSIQKLIVDLESRLDLFYPILKNKIKDYQK